MMMISAFSYTWENSLSLISVVSLFRLRQNEPNGHLRPLFEKQRIIIIIIIMYPNKFHFLAFISRNSVIRYQCYNTVVASYQNSYYFHFSI